MVNFTCTVDLTNFTGKNVSQYAYGLATGQLANTGFSDCNNPIIVSSLAQLTPTLMRVNADQGIARAYALGNTTIMDNWWAKAPSFMDPNYRLVMGVGPANNLAFLDSPATWANYCVTFATAMKNQGHEIFYWEIGDNNDAMVAGTYNSYFSQMATALKSVNAGYKIGGSGNSFYGGGPSANATINIQTWANSVGSLADFFSFHNYGVTPSVTTTNCYLNAAGVGFNLTPPRLALAATPIPNIPTCISEWNLDSIIGDEPRQSTYIGAVYAALALTNAFLTDSHFDMAALLDATGDSFYGVIGNIANGNNYNIIDPQGYYLGYAGQNMGGPQVLVTSVGFTNGQILAVKNGNQITIQLINYDTVNDSVANLTLIGGPFIGPVTRWDLGKSNIIPTISVQASLSSIIVPSEQIVILTGPIAAIAPGPSTAWSATDEINVILGNNNLTALMASTGTIANTGGGGGTTTRNPSTIPFDSASVWNIGIGAGAIWGLSADVDVTRLRSLTPQINAGNLGQPIYFGGPNDPIVTFNCNANDGANNHPWTAQFHCPAGALPSTGGDLSMNLYDSTQPNVALSMFHCTSPAFGSLVAGSVVTSTKGGILDLTKNGILASTDTIGGTSTGGATRTWWTNPGGDGSMFVLPMQTGMNALWQRSGTMVNAMRSGPGSAPRGNQGSINTFCTPWYRGVATDPLVSLINSGGNTVMQVHIPVGATAENSFTGGSPESGLGGIDTTKPYVVWGAQDATVNGSVGGAIHSGTGNFINGSIFIEDGTGPLVMDAVTGANFPNLDNMVGNIQDFDLTALRNNSDYFPQHMMTIYFDPSVSALAHIWPLVIHDNIGNGPIVEGALIGIPADVPMPTNLSPGGKFLWRNAQQFGWLHYNIGGGNVITLKQWVINSVNNAVADDISNSMGDIVPHLCIYTGQTSLRNMKGMVNGVRSDAFPAPPVISYAETGGHPVQPSSFGAWKGNDGSIWYDTIWPQVAGSGSPTNSFGPADFTGSDDYLGGVITQYDISQGIIQHMIRLVISTNALKSPNAVDGSHANIPWPNYHVDFNAPETYTGTILAGSTFGIPSTVNINNLGLTAGGLMLAKCLQDYGAVWRGSSGTSSIIGYSVPELEGDATLADMRTDFTSKILPVLNILRNQSTDNGLTNVNGGGTRRVPPLPPVGIGNVINLTGITLSNSSFVGGSPNGTVVGSITVQATGGTFSGSLSLTGTNASFFRIIGNNLVTNGVIAGGSYNINIVATQSGATGSPFTSAKTITGTSVSSGSPRQNLMNFLNAKKGINVITAQMSFPDEHEFDGDTSAIGQPVGMMCNNFWLFEGANSFDTSFIPRQIAHWNAGGLVECEMFFPNPDSPGSSRGRADLTACITPNTSQNNTLKGYMDQAAGGLLQFKAQGIPVITRMMHEFDVGAFWWDAQTSGPAAYIAMWKYIHDYIVITKGCDHLLWAYAPNGGPEQNLITQCYPGDNYVDIVGVDAYPSNPNDPAGYQGVFSTLTAMAPSKPTAFTEFGFGGPSHPAGGSVSLLRTEIQSGLFGSMSYIMMWSGWNWSLDSNLSDLNNSFWLNRNNMNRGF